MVFSLDNLSRKGKISLAMEEIVKEPNSTAAKAGRSTSRLLRYPLRSASKAKEEKPPVIDASKSSASGARGRNASTVSKSVGVLDLSGEEKSAKPPRRMSIPTKSSANHAPKLVGNITPISEARAKKSTSNSIKSDTPVSDVSKAATRKNFNRLSSAPYWVSQIKLSESAAKHSISLGFFRLALEAECESLQLLRDELKSYVRRHNLAEFGDSLKELFESYNILDKLDQLQLSETCSFVPEDENRSSDDDVLSSSSVKSVEKQKLKPLSIGATEVYQVKDMNKETSQKNFSSTCAAEVYRVKGMKKDQKNDPTTKTRKSARTKAANQTSGLQSGGGNTQKKPQKPRKQELNKVRDKVKQQGKKSSDEEGPIISPPAEKSLQENKENMDAAQTESSLEV